MAFRYPDANVDMEEVEKIVKHWNPTVTDSDVDGDWFSLALTDKKSGITLWMDCHVDKYGDLECEWNQYIFNTSNSKDMLIQALQDNNDVFELCDSECYSWAVANGFTE